MNVGFLRRFIDEPLLTFAAICFGAFVVIADVILFAWMLDRSPNFSEPIALFINGLLTAAPFLWLAYRRSNRLLPWLIGIALTLWLWWRWLQNGVAYQRAPDGSGVDMGFALLMLVSPIFIGAVCVWIDDLLRLRSRTGYQSPT